MFSDLKGGAVRVIRDVSYLTAREAKEQGGIISGDNPAAFNTADPIRLWVIQVGIIIIFTYVLSLGLSKLRQPRVIAEVIGGVILGPTVMGRIPGFTENIFPKASLPYLNLTATIALVLFLFLVGLETDVRVMRNNARASALISAAGILLPFGLGAGVAVPIYNEFINPENASFGHFLLFTGVAISITAFPVLCRILTELKLLDSTVGLVVLAAGVGNDVVGWILLALTVALVNAGSGLVALYILLTGVAWVLFLLIPVKRAFHWLARRDGSLDSGVPSPFMMTVTLLLVFASAFFTDIIGIHAIFGGFLAGLVVPHEGGFAIALVEKIEDLVTLLLLPIYFTLSGLNTNLGLLDNGVTWGYVILIIVVAFVGKFVGCFGTARMCGFNLRESGAIGTLMSCKGLVELIVLNIGLQAGILDDRVFSMFVVMALVLTFITTPLTLWVYPQAIRIARDAPRVTATSDTDSDKEEKRSSGEFVHVHPTGDHKSSLAVVLNKFEHLPAIMTLVQLLQPPLAPKEKSPHPPRAPISIEALRLVELTDRTSAVMKGSGSEELLRRDALLNVFRTFGQLNRIRVSSSLSVVQHDYFASTVSAHAAQSAADLVIVPWSSGLFASEENHSSVAGPASAPQPISSNPFDSLFGKTPSADKSVIYSHFIRKVFAESPADVGLYVDRGLSEALDGSEKDHHIFMPFFGGPDDRAALNFVVQLCDNPGVSATIVRMTKSAPIEIMTPSTTYDTIDRVKAFGMSVAGTGHSITAFPDTVYGQQTTETRLSSQTADNIAWAKVTGGTSSRITFSELASPLPLHAAIERLGALSRKDVLIIAGRARRMAVDSHSDELQEMVIAKGQAPGSVSETTKTIGCVATGFVVSTTFPLLVFQAAEQFGRR